MKKIVFVLLGCCVACVARGADCERVECPSGDLVPDVYGRFCRTEDTVCYAAPGDDDIIIVQTCKTCYTGYTTMYPAFKAKNPLSTAECSNHDQGYMTCECVCGDDCVGHDWQQYVDSRGRKYPGVESHLTARCDCVYDSPACTRATTYRCAAGYYGVATVNVDTGVASGCTKCPSYGDLEATSVAGIASRVDYCFLPQGSTGADETGAFEHTDDCWY